MSLILQSKIEPEGVFGIWRVTEDDAFFLQNLDLYSIEIEELKLLKARKRTEWLSSRYLLHLLSERSIRGACLKDEYGKPYLENSSYHISISHSSDYTAVIGSIRLVGIDIQVIVPKILRIASKFINDNEWKYIPTTDAMLYFHVVWGAKEAMYKAYGKKQLDFKKDMEVKPFIFNANGFFFEGSLIKGDTVQNFSLFCRQIDQIILVYALEN
ncbi:MAG: 4'-phosphopantetheinyl transferase superfamily protein [Saprospiraceae bacterium]|nr:4'-phosphopantetheinyl transferase superfamily protein [Saprospiraceae bacterium]